MKEVLNILLEYVIAYVLVFILYFFIFVRKKTKYDKNKVPVEFYYLVSLYRLDQKKINYKKFIYASAFINTFIIVTTYIIITRLLDKLVWQVIVGIVLIVLLIVICYGLLGRYYQRKAKIVKNDSVEKTESKNKTNNKKKKEKNK